MSQLDLIAQLRENRPVAPRELREHIRQLAAGAPAPKRRVTWRRALVVAVPIAAAAVVAGAFLPGSGERQAAVTADPRGSRQFAPPAVGGLANAGRAPSMEALEDSRAAATPKAAAGTDSALQATTPPPSSTNAQRYSATLRLRLPNANAISAATNDALRIVASMGGHPNTVDVDAARKDGRAYLVLKVPRHRVQEAVQKLGALGTIVGADVSIQDLQAGIDRTGRAIERLQTRLAGLREQSQTEEVTTQIAALTKELQRLQQKRATTLRAAQFATVKLHMQTPVTAVQKEQEDGPLDGLGVIFRWLGIGAVYVLALGTPLVLLVALGWFLARGMRRRREEQLLSQA
jgi:hypothetical protein